MEYRFGAFDSVIEHCTLKIVTCNFLFYVDCDFSFQSGISNIGVNGEMQGCEGCVTDKTFFLFM